MWKEVLCRKAHVRPKLGELAQLKLHPEFCLKVREAKINLKPSRVQSNCNAILARPVAAMIIAVGDSRWCRSPDQARLRSIPLEVDERTEEFLIGGKIARLLRRLEAALG
ncbi:uncharacterized protein LOC104445571 [Eucalyptus grandis]|uniref:uncharacterized protein LOC104445571 n=1 Tax=Eucalyptus grandis TaxID=71139 RepID=UPI00192EACA0|nr:uncharacterized protein LOC104445571 [Eucalyptus grandis]